MPPTAFLSCAWTAPSQGEVQLESLKEVLELEKNRTEELRQERDRWASTLEASQRQPVDLTRKPRRGFMGWLRRA